jgi:hypothetical protein
MEITVNFRCMYSGRGDTVVLTGFMAQRYSNATYKGSLIESLETVDSDSVHILSEHYSFDDE